MSWIDKIESAVQNVDIFKKKFYWMDEDVILKDKLSKIEFLKKVRAFVKKTPTCNPNEFADELCFSLEKQIITQSKSPLDLKMNWDKLEHAKSDFLLLVVIAIHVILSFLDKKKLDYELDTSIDICRKRRN